MKETKPIKLGRLAEKYHVSKQCIYVAIKKGRLIAHKKNKFWYIFEADFDSYRATKYSRENQMFNGEKVFRSDLKEISVPQAAKLLGINTNTTYSLIRSGKIPSMRKGVAIVLKFDDVVAYYEKNSMGDPRQLKFA